MRIYYEGKMTDEYPAWVWQVITGYVQDPLEFVKIIDYFRGKYGRKRPKIRSCFIKEIVRAPKVEEPKLTVWRSDGLNSKDGQLYYFRTVTHIDIADQHYRVEQEGLIWVSECLGQVLKRTATLLNETYLGSKFILRVGD